MILSEAHHQPVAAQFLDMEIGMHERRSDDRCLNQAVQNFISQLHCISSGDWRFNCFLANLKNQSGQADESDSGFCRVDLSVLQLRKRRTDAWSLGHPE